ncbi:MAG: hypothetical protein JWR18_2341, partial [Segetibacter sp.]|nr:hypothetical protein [Segetibacter sp.]
GAKSKKASKTKMQSTHVGVGVIKLQVQYYKI